MKMRLKTIFLAMKCYLISLTVTCISYFVFQRYDIVFLPQCNILQFYTEAHPRSYSSFVKDVENYFESWCETEIQFDHDLERFYEYASKPGRKIPANAKPFQDFSICLSISPWSKSINKIFPDC